MNCEGKKNVSDKNFNENNSSDEIVRRKSTNLIVCCDPDNIIETKPTKTSKKAENVLILVSMITIIFIALEFTGGIIANSLAIMTDAFHMVSDLAGFLISIIALRMARKKPTVNFSYGFYRAEMIGALASVILIWVLTFSLLITAIIRIYNNDYEVDADTMLITAGASVVFNVIMMLILHFGHQAHSHYGISHAHSHVDNTSHSHNTKNNNIHPCHMDEHRNSKSELTTIQPSKHNHHKHHRNINVRAALIHVIGDLLQSIGVVVAGLIIKYTGWELADPLCTLTFSILVMLTTVHVIKDVLSILMEATPFHISYETVKLTLLNIDKVTGLHSLRLWSLSMEKHCASVHLEITDDANFEIIISEANKILKEQFGCFFVSVQVNKTKIVYEDDDDDEISSKSSSNVNSIAVV
ncbi:Cation efflux protein family and Cation efflux protein transmembrane domain-containing protein [Strongyloides ratti]|uniref:Cation efflux protein family and Cation efflux protein transmembrane domain-containing protein n=1 Tax=Strongyloides ratti TaxID=34506 RepID=A0A090KUW8_STRRB|nr:Cation efflux protein family and Cation efflux protein transmembrane domain-containing protein [Strongyloides ratti]CEF61300.1 Cation efflux protein family and Cation efflux protein transmembrane domain-containing protein [Strongyloides ratti]